MRKEVTCKVCGEKLPSHGEGVVHVGKHTTQELNEYYKKEAENDREG